MPTDTRPIDPELWDADFFPPITPWRILVRFASMALVFLLWLVLSGLICVGLLKLGFKLDIAALIGVPTPPLVMVLLNSVGRFNRPRGDQKTLKAFQRWIAGPGGLRHGLIPEHLANVAPDGRNTLRIEVTPAWLEQSPEKRLADLNSWYVVWDFCRNARPDRAPMKLAVLDQAGRVVGGTKRDGGGSIWVRDDADELPG